MGKTKTAFKYQGREFEPLLTLRGKASDFFEISKHIRDTGITPNKWNYEEFYKIAKEHGAEKTDLFRWNGKVVIPAENYLFEYEGKEAKPYLEEDKKTEGLKKPLHEMSFQEILDGLHYVDNGVYDSYVLASDERQTLIVKNLTKKQMIRLKNIHPDILEMNPRSLIGKGEYCYDDIRALEHFQFVKHQINKSSGKEVHPVYW